MSVKNPGQLEVLTSVGDLDLYNDLSLIWDKSAAKLKGILPSNLPVPDQDGVFYASRYGATGDGVTDDTAAIGTLRAAAYAYASSGLLASVIFDPGIYKVTDASLFQIFDNLTIVGYGATIYFPSGGTVRDTTATETYVYDNGLFYSTSSDIDTFSMFGLTFNIDDSRVCALQIGDSGTLNGSITGNRILVEDNTWDGGAPNIVIGCNDVRWYENVCQNGSLGVFARNNTFFRTQTDGSLHVAAFGAVGDDSSDDFLPLSFAFNALNGNEGGTLTLGTDLVYKVTAALPTLTYPFKLSGGGYTSQIKSYLTGDATLITVDDGVQFWEMDNFTITSNYTYSSFLTGATDGAACTGIAVGAGAGTTSRWRMSNLFIRGLKVGMNIDGFIVALDNVFFRECETGLILNNTASAGAYDLGLRFENCRQAYAITNANALVLRQPLDEGVLSTGEHVASTIDNCDSVKLIAPYWEEENSRSVSYLIVGGTTECRDVHIEQASIAGVVGLTVTPVLIDKVDGGHATYTGSTGATHTLINTTANTKNFTIDYMREAGVWPLDTGKIYGQAYNYFPNSTFDCWFRGWYDVTYSGVTASRETTLVRRGPNALKIALTSVTGVASYDYVRFTLSDNGTSVASPSVAALAGKNVLIGAWVYVPSGLSDFTSTSPSGSELCQVNLYATSDTNGSGAGLTDSDTLTGGAYTHHVVPGTWNFIWARLSVVASATTIRVYVYLNRGGVPTTTSDYIVIDEIGIYEDKVPFQWIVQGLVTTPAPTIDATCAGGLVTFYTDTTPADTTQTYVDGDRQHYRTITTGQPHTKICSTPGAGGTAVFTSLGNL